MGKYDGLGTLDWAAKLRMPESAFDRMTRKLSFDGLADRVTPRLADKWTDRDMGAAVTLARELGKVHENAAAFTGLEDISLAQKWADDISLAQKWADEMSGINTVSKLILDASKLMPDPKAMGIISESLGSLQVLEDVMKPWAHLQPVFSSPLFRESGRITIDPDEEITEETVEPLIITPDQFSPKVTAYQLAVMRALILNPELIKTVDPFDFEKIVAELMTCQGYYDVRVTRKSKDEGRDIEARRTINGFPSRVFVECKRWKNAVPVLNVRALLGTIQQEGVPHGVMVTSGRVSRDGLKFISKSSGRLTSNDYNDLVGWVEAWAEVKKPG